MLAYDAPDRPAARTVEAQATALARALGGPALRDWLEHWVPQAQHFHEEHRDHRFGSVLVEGADGTMDSLSMPASTWVGAEGSSPGEAAEPRTPLRPPPAPPAAAAARPPQGRQHPVAMAAAGRRTGLLAASLALGVPLGVALGSMAMLGAGAWWWFHRAPVEAPEPAITPAEEAPAQVEPQLPTTPEPARPRSRAATEPVVVPAEAEPVTPTTGRVLVTGDAKSVWFESPTGRSGAGDLAEGSYVVMATFADGLPRKAGTVVVAGGTSVVVHCVEEFTRCRVE